MATTKRPCPFPYKAAVSCVVKGSRPANTSGMDIAGTFKCVNTPDSTEPVLDRMQSQATYEGNLKYVACGWHDGLYGMVNPYAYPGWGRWVSTTINAQTCAGWYYPWTVNNNPTWRQEAAPLIQQFWDSKNLSRFANYYIDRKADYDTQQEVTTNWYEGAGTASRSCDGVFGAGFWNALPDCGNHEYHYSVWGWRPGGVYYPLSACAVAGTIPATQRVPYVADMEYSPRPGNWNGYNWETIEVWKPDQNYTNGVRESSGLAHTALIRNETDHWGFARLSTISTKDAFSITTTLTSAHTAQMASEGGYVCLWGTPTDLAPLKAAQDAGDILVTRTSRLLDLAFAYQFAEFDEFAFGSRKVIRINKLPDPIFYGTTGRPLTVEALRGITFRVDSDSEEYDIWLGNKKVSDEVITRTGVDETGKETIGITWWAVDNTDYTSMTTAQVLAIFDVTPDPNQYLISTPIPFDSMVESVTNLDTAHLNTKRLLISGSVSESAPPDDVASPLNTFGVSYNFTLNFIEYTALNYDFNLVFGGAVKRTGTQLTGNMNEGLVGSML